MQKNDGLSYNIKYKSILYIEIKKIILINEKEVMLWNVDKLVIVRNSSN